MSAPTIIPPYSFSTRREIFPQGLWKQKYSPGKMLPVGFINFCLIPSCQRVGWREGTVREALRLRRRLFIPFLAEDSRVSLRTSPPCFLGAKRFFLTFLSVVGVCTNNSYSRHIFNPPGNFLLRLTKRRFIYRKKYYPCQNDHVGLALGLLTFV